MRKMIHVEIGSELNDGLKLQAKKEYTTVSALVRSIIREYLGDERNATIFSRSQKNKSVVQEVPIVDDFEQSLKENL